MAGFLKSWSEEKQSAYLYRHIAKLEKEPSRGKLFRSLAEAAEEQSLIWAEKIRKSGGKELEAYSPDLRTRVVAGILSVFGPRAMLTVLAAMKVRGISIYCDLRPPHGEQRHRALTGGANLRAAVFGFNDGLVSNASLILGVAGASVQPSVVLLTGVAGLLAGAFSMSAGEYISVRSQRELYEFQIGLERDEIEEYPEDEAEELRLIYEAKGVPSADAKAMAEKLIADPERALDTLAKEELGLNPAELGSPWGAAISSFMAFAVGAFLPLIPFLFTHGGLQLRLTIGLTAISLFVVGCVISLFTGRRALWSGLRMLLIGSAVGAVTYSIGRLMGVALS
ncbi:MAG: VIT1/CCC1 transporter family protein [Pseudomonadota bacterium]